jgi:Na+/H+ antiporter NhaD/arsenite permease-like protein
LNALRIAVASLVAVVWAVVYLASVFNPDVHAPPELCGVMLAVVTWLFSRALRDGLKQHARDVAQKVLDETSPADETP